MKKIHGNSWSMVSCNRIVAEKTEKDKHARHLEKLNTVKASIDNASPQPFPHLKAKLKTKKLQEDRVSEIQLENRILLQKMLNIDVKPSDLSCERMSKCRVPPRSLNAGKNAREMDRISKANQDLLKRLQNTTASVDPKEQLRAEEKRAQLCDRLSENAYRFRKSGLLSMPDVSRKAFSPVDSLNVTFGPRTADILDEFNIAFPPDTSPT
eukprot:GEMP01072404.1.p1 GENE.GEMP01072404.1~~GEMP01072404.1.p1  ORF type:complete len:210 (+),score=38.93 GEMP01072404.1:114-743(+)